MCVASRVSRRVFLRTGTGIFLFGGPLVVWSTSGCADQEKTLTMLIAASIAGLTVSEVIYLMNQDVSGTIEPSNSSDKDQQGDVQLGLLDSQENVVDGGRAPYSVPTGYTNVYEWSGLRSDQTGEYKAMAESAVNSAESATFTVQ